MYKLIHPMKGIIPLDVSKPSFVAYHLMRAEVLKKREELINDWTKDYKSWLKEYATIKFSMGRQQGTSTIVDYNCFVEPEKTLVIGYKLAQKQRFKHAKHFLSHRSDFEEIFKHGNFRGKSFEYVFVDCAEFMSSTKKEELYDVLCECQKDIKHISFMQ